MKHTHIKSLLAVAGISVVVAFLIPTGTDNHAPSDHIDGINQPFLKGLDLARDSVAKIALQKGDKSLTLVKTDKGQWQLATLANYPADTSLVHKALTSLQKVVRLKPRSDNPELYPRMELAEKALHVTLSSTDKVLYNFDMGKAGQIIDQKATRYARNRDVATSWLVNAPDELSLDAIDWVDTLALQLDASRVWQVSVNPMEEGATAFRLIKDQSSGKFAPETLADDEKVSDAYRLEALAASFNSMRFDAVKPAAEMPLNAGRTLQVKTYDGLVVTAKVDVNAAGEAWLSLNAGTNSPAAADQMPEVVKNAPADVEKEALSLNNRWAGWVYRLPSYAQSDIQTERTDIITKSDVEPAQK